MRCCGKLYACARTVIFTNLLSRIFGRAARVEAADRAAINACLQQGYRSQHAGEHAAAERSYRRALELDAGNVDAHGAAGKLSRRQ